jgi:hypothetical protein
VHYKLSNNIDIGNISSQAAWEADEKTGIVQNIKKDLYYVKRTG